MKNWSDKWLFWLLKPLSLLPLGCLYAFSDLFLFPVVYLLVGYRRKVVRTNLANAFPHWSKAERKRVEVRFYHHFCDSFMEMIKVLSLSPEEAGRRMHFVNPEVVTDFAAKNQGVLLLIGHYGNWEYQPFLFLNMLKQGNQQGYSVYRPLKSRAFDYLYQRIRTRFNGGIVAKDDTYRLVIRLRRDNIPGVFGLVSDQSPSKNNLHYWTTFLNQDTAILTGPERMAKQTGFAVVYGDVTKVKRGYYQTQYICLTDQPKEEPENSLTERYARLMEATILRDPAYWLWTHKRWKHKRTEHAN
ncbi:MAG: lysophospholipid acyltransferase family protein [Bacteroidales bacterium]|nr:lysophospholipid acyltransferase family protein [Bacteroidales bacterium]